VRTRIRGRGAAAAVLLAAALVAALPARAVLRIEITQGVEGAYPIAVVPFGWRGPGAPPEDVAAIVARDLHLSGRFQLLPEREMPARPSHAGEVAFPAWRALGLDALVVGRLEAAGPDAYVVQFQLLDVYQRRQLLGYRIPARRGQLRRVAHRIADLVYEKLTGERGAFDTQVAYVSVERAADGARTYRLVVADSDGARPRALVTSRAPLLSPAWSPDGRRIAYVSFESGRPEVYVQELASGTRRRVAAFRGHNGAPAFSPDGRRLALSLSRDGNPEIYVLDLAGGGLRRLTHDPAIDTEPTWSPDGRWIAFTSDRGGSPQVYRVPAAGGRVERLTFEGGYNARPVYAPDGRSLALVHGARGRYRVAVLDLASGTLQVLTDGRLDESPSFAPNGRMILYATRGPDGRGVLAAVSADGAVRQRLVLQEGEVREPAWGPFRTDGAAAR